MQGDNSFDLGRPAVESSMVQVTRVVFLKSVRSISPRLHPQIQQSKAPRSSEVVRVLIQKSELQGAILGVQG